jgi:hypothetical protein
LCLFTLAAAPPVIDPSDPVAVVELKRQLQFVHLKIQLLEERLRLQRIQKYGPVTNSLWRMVEHIDITTLDLGTIRFPGEIELCLARTRAVTPEPGVGGKDACCSPALGLERIAAVSATYVEDCSPSQIVRTADPVER